MTKVGYLLLGAIFAIIGIALLIYAAIRLGQGDIQYKGEGIRLWGLNLNDLISLLGGIVSLVSGVVTMISAQRRAPPAVRVGRSPRGR